MNRTTLTLGLWSSLVCLSLATQPACGQAVLYKAARVYTMLGDPLTPGEVLVVDGKISAVGTTVEPLEGAEIVDLADATLVPGFVDAYSQAGIAGGTDEFTAEVTPDFLVSRVINWQDRSLKEALHGGTTTLAISPGTENVIAGMSSVIKTVGEHDTRQLLKPQASLVVNLCSDPQRRNSSRSRPDGLYVRQPTNRMGVVWILRSTFDRTKRGLEPSPSENITAALDGNLPLFAVSRTMYDLTALLTLSKEFELSPIVVGGQEAYQVSEQLAAAGVPVILGPLTTAGDNGPEGTTLAWNNAGLLEKSGVTIAISGGDLLEQARFAHRFGLSRETALKAITQTPAQLLGIADRVGVIAPGFDADLVALDGDPLALTTSIRWVMVNGNRFHP